MSTQRDDPDGIDQELQAHLDLEADALAAEGLPPDAARAEARRRLGNWTAAREHTYEAGRWQWLDGFAADAREAMRAIRRRPLAALFVVASLAGGISVTAVTLAVRKAVFYSPPPLYRNAAQLARIRINHADRPPHQSSRVPAALFAELRRAQLPIEAATVGSTAAEIEIRGRKESAVVRDVTPGLFSMLGVAPMLDGLTPADSGDVSAVVLSFRAWQRLFGARPDAVGQLIWIAQRPMVVAAVMPERFWLTDMTSPIWRISDFRAIAADEPLDVIVRTPPGSSAQSVASLLDAGMRAYVSRLPADARQMRLQVRGIEGTPVGEQVSLALPYLLGACALLTLVIACANAAILTMAQWTARERELAIRASIGAGRARLVRSLVTESLVLAAASGGMGIALTYGLRAYVSSRTGDVQFFDLSIPWQVLGEVTVVTILSGLTVGLLPALLETRRLGCNPARRPGDGDRTKQRWRHGLVVTEVAVTVSLLVATASMIDGYRRALSADPGFSMEPLVGASLRHPDGLDATRLVSQLVRLDGVAAAAASTTIPYGAIGRDARVSASVNAPALTTRRSDVGTSFFGALGVPLVAGREFTTQDTAESAVILNEALARRLAAEGAVPATVHVDGNPRAVVGIVRDFSSGLFGRSFTHPEVFLPLAGGGHRSINVLIRTRENAGARLEPIREHLRKTVPGVEIRRVYALSHIRDLGAQEILAGSTPLIPLSAMGILLTMAGIYGVLAFSVVRRSRELAVRVAVGATPRDIIALVGRQSTSLVAIGLCIGIGLTFALTQALRANGGAGTVFDPAFPAFVVPALLVVTIGAAATWLPARRATRIDPAGILRSN